MTNISPFGTFRLLTWGRLILFLGGLVIWLGLTPGLGFSQMPAQQNPGNVLSALEQQLYGYPYYGHTDMERLDRLEQNIYGNTQEGTVEGRIERLKEDVIQNRPQVPAPQSASDPSKTPLDTTPMAQPIVGESDYPTLSQLETDLFRKTYETEDITKRLDRIEQKIFGKVVGGGLADRVDRLRPMTQPPPIQYGAPPPPQSSLPPPTDLSPYPLSPYALPPANPAGYPSIPGVLPNSGSPAPTALATPNLGSEAVPPDMTAALDQVERDLLKSTYTNDSVDTRLARLEMKIFQRTAPPGTPPADRLERIISVAMADNGTPEARASARAGGFRSILPILIMLIPMFL